MSAMALAKVGRSVVVRRGFCEDGRIDIVRHDFADGGSNAICVMALVNAKASRGGMTFTPISTSPPPD